MMDQAEQAASYAIYAAKQHGVDEVAPDHILLGCLRTISRYGIASLGGWNIDLESLGVDWVTQPAGPRPKVAYSQAAVELFDRAAKIARSLGEASVGLHHLLAAFSSEDAGLMGELKREYGISSASWRAAVAQLAPAQAVPAQMAPPQTALPIPEPEPRPEPRQERDYLTPEEAAEVLGVHVQTMRAYIRNERLPAFRLAGERAIRILRTDLYKVMEPLKGEKQEEQHGNLRR